MEDIEIERMDKVDNNYNNKVFVQNIGETSLKLPDVPTAGAKM